MAKWGQYDSLENVPLDALEWLIPVREKELEEIRGEVMRRQLSAEGQWTVERRIVELGFREIVKSLHPDRGGSEEDFKVQYEQIKQARLRLDLVLKELESQK